MGTKGKKRVTGIRHQPRNLFKKCRGRGWGLPKAWKLGFDVSAEKAGFSKSTGSAGEEGRMGSPGILLE